MRCAVPRVVLSMYNAGSFKYWTHVLQYSTSSSLSKWSTWVYVPLPSSYLLSESDGLGRGSHTNLVRIENFNRDHWMFRSFAQVASSPFVMRLAIYFNCNFHFLFFFYRVAFEFDFLFFNYLKHAMIFLIKNIYNHSQDFKLHYTYGLN